MMPMPVLVSSSKPIDLASKTTDLFFHLVKSLFYRISVSTFGAGSLEDIKNHSKSSDNMKPKGAQNRGPNSLARSSESPGRDTEQGTRPSQEGTHHNEPGPGTDGWRQKTSGRKRSLF